MSASHDPQGMSRREAELNRRTAEYRRALEKLARTSALGWERNIREKDAQEARDALWRMGTDGRKRIAGVQSQVHRSE